MSDAETPPRRTTPRWVKVVLVVSLAVNLAVVGAVVGAVLRHGAWDSDGHRALAANRIGRAYVHALSREDRRAIWRAMHADRKSEARAPHADRIRDEFDAMLRALRSTPYDPQAVREIMTRQMQAGLARQKMGQRLMQERLADMTAQERAGYADRLEQALSRPRGAPPGHR